MCNSLLKCALVVSVTSTLLGCGPAPVKPGDLPAGALTLDLVKASTLVNHWPGADGMIGTPDDTTSGSNSALNKSEPNLNGSRSFNAFDFGGAATEAGLPEHMNAVTFLAGTVSIDPTVAKSGGGALIVGWSFSGTQPYSGHGAYTAVITKVNSGTYDATSHALTADVDFSAGLGAGTALAAGFKLTGDAIFREAADFDTKTGDAYFDDVLVPMAKAASAKSLLLTRASGTVPASAGGTGGMFPSMPLKNTLVAIGK